MKRKIKLLSITSLSMLQLKKWHKLRHKNKHAKGDSEVVKLEGFKNITLDEAIREIKKLRQSLVGAVQNAECREEKLEQEIERLREKVKREKQFKSKIFEQSLDKSKEIVRVKKDLGYETDQSLWKGKEIERLKKEKDDLVLANKGRKALTGAQFRCMEKLEKENEWLVNTWVEDVSDGDGILSKDTLREGLIKDMQQAQL